MSDLNNLINYRRNNHDFSKKLNEQLIFTFFSFIHKTSKMHYFSLTNNKPLLYKNY